MSDNDNPHSADNPPASPAGPSGTDKAPDKSATDGGIGGFFGFKVLALPAFAKYLYLLLSLLVLLLGLGRVIWGYYGDFRGGVSTLYHALIFTVLWLVIVRVGCELAVALFQIRDALQTQKNNG